MHFSRNEVALFVVSALLAVGGLYADDNAVKVPCLLLSVLLLVCICAVHKGPRLLRFAVGALLIATLALLLVHGRKRDHEKAQEDVDSKLALSLFLPTSHDIARIRITVTNNSGREIIEHSVRCGIERVNLKPRGVFEGFSMQESTPEKLIIKANGDADTSYCAAPFAHSVLPLACADITPVVYYSLSDQPEITKTKEFRFVMTSDDEKWHQQPVNDAREYCPADWPH